MKNFYKIGLPKFLKIFFLVAVLPAAVCFAIYSQDANRTNSAELKSPYYLEVDGEVCSASSVQVYPDVSGIISSVKVSVGDVVNRGDILAYVDPSLPGLDYMPSPIRAPISGCVVSPLPVAGTTVWGKGDNFVLLSPSSETGTAIFQSSVITTIMDTSNIEIKAEIPQDFVHSITKGQKAIVTLSAFPEIEIPAELCETAPILNPTNQTLSVKFRFDDSEHLDLVLIGMRVKIRVCISSEKMNEK